MSKYLFQKKQRGSVLIILGIFLVVLLGFAGMTIDMGNILVVRSELQTAADAAALAGAGTLSNPGNVTSVAQQYAVSNHPNHGTILQSADVQTGIWNQATNTFTATGSSPNAVQVTVRRTAANGNPVDLYIMPVLGISTVDVTATATAQITYPAFTYGVSGLSSIAISGVSKIDSYDASQGPYGPTNSANNGNIASNGNITLSGNTKVNGSANPGAGHTVTTTGSSTVTGSTTPLTQALSYPSISAPSSYNNNGLGSSLTVSGNNIVNLAPGTYYFSSITASGNSQINVSGPTTIYVSGSISMSGNGFVNNSTNPNNLSLLLTPSVTSAAFSGNTDFYGSIYGPQTALAISGNSAVYGAIVAKSVSISGNSGIHQDTALKQSFLPPIIQLVK